MQFLMQLAPASRFSGQLGHFLGEELGVMPSDPRVKSLNHMHPPMIHIVPQSLTYGHILHHNMSLLNPAKVRGRDNFRDDGSLQVAF